MRLQELAQGLEVQGYKGFQDLPAEMRSFVLDQLLLAQTEVDRRIFTVDGLVKRRPDVLVGPTCCDLVEGLSGLEGHG